MKLRPAHWIPRALPVFGGALAVATGGTMLLGWAWEIDGLKSIRPEWVAVKPNTAVAFVLIGLASLLAARERAWGRGRRTEAGSEVAAGRALVMVYLAGRIAGLIAGVLGLLSLAEYAFDWNPGFDQWLFPEPTGAVGTSHPGRMAPDSAICFALLAVGLESARVARQAPVRLFVVETIGALVTTIGLAEILTYFAPLLRTYGWGGLTMMALPTAVLFVALGLALVGIALSREKPVPGESAGPFGPPETKASLKFLLIFGGLAVGIVAAGAIYYRNIERRFRLDAEQQLAAIAYLKVGELVHWRKERIADGAIQQNNPAFTQLVRRSLASPPEPEAQRQLQAWLLNLQIHFGYRRVSLLDTQGTERLAALGTAEPACAEVAAHLAPVLQAGRVTLLDFHREAPDRPIHLSVLVPILEESDGRRPLALLVLQIDPGSYLFPFISRWPLPSETAETLLVRREGQEAVFLNELRFRANSALSMRAPLASTGMPAVRAALGQEGVVEGIDYRGVPVLAALRAVPDSPWFLVARRDVAEVYGPLRAQLWQVICVMGGLLFSAGAGVGLVWRQQRLRFYQARVKVAEALTESERRLSEAQSLAKIGSYEMNLRDGNWRCSKALEDLFGIDQTHDHSVAGWTALIHPDDRSRMVDYLSREVIDRHQPFEQKYRIVRADNGAVRWVQGWGHLLFNDAGQPVALQGSIQDITESHLAALALQQSEDLLNETGRIARIGGWRIDLATRELRWTEAVFLIHEVALDFRPTVEAAINFYAPECRPIIQQAVERSIQSGEPFDLELELITAQQRRLTVNAIGHIEREAGEAKRVVGVIQDITQHKQAQAALRESEKANRILIQNLHAGVVVHAPDTQIKLANEQASTLLGLSIEQLLGKSAVDPAWAFLREDEAPMRLEEFPVNRVIATLQPLRDLVVGVCRPRTRDQVWLLVNAFPEFDDREQLRQIVVTFVDLTARKLAEAAVRKSESRYRLLAENAVDVIWVLDAESESFRYMSPSIERLLGFTDAEFVGRTLVETVTPASLAFIRRVTPGRIAEMLQGDRSSHIDEIEVFHRSGRIVVTEINMRFLRNRESGRIEGTGVMRDITERKQAEAALQREKANLDAIFETSPVALFIVDERTNIVRVNTAAVILTGGDAAAVLQHRPGNALRCVHAAEDPRGCGYGPGCPLCPARNAMEALLANGGALHGAELRLELMRNGAPEPVWLALDAEVVQLDGRRHLCVAMEDITARKQAAAINAARLHLIEYAAVHTLDELLEETLNEAEKLSGSVIGFYHFVEPDQVTLTLQNWSTRTKAEFCRAEGKGSHYAIDKAGVWVDCVRQRQPVIHNDYASLPHRKGMPEGHATVIRQLVVPVMQGGKVMAILGVGNKPDLYTSVDVALVSELAGLAWHIAVRKRAEEEVHRLNAVLEQRVRERTAELEAANKELEAFSYSVSHDLRAPLRSLDGFSRIVLEDYAAKLDDEGRDSLHRIRAAAQRMGHLIDDMLTLSRVSRSELDWAQVDLAAIAREVVASLRQREPARAVEVVLPDELKAEGDARLLRIALENLLGNAWKFTLRCAAPRIEFGVGPNSHRAGSTSPHSFFVRDNGAGFNPAYAGKLFGAFQRLHSNAEFPGTGVGLATVQRVIHRHGGRIWAESQVDAGATFYFTLERNVGAETR